SATRLTEYVQQMGKAYFTTVRLGARSDTDDADGTVTPAAVARPPARDDVERCLKEFVGEVGQGPPAFSAATVPHRTPSPLPTPPTSPPHRLPRAPLRVPRAGPRGALRQGDVHPLAGPRPRRAARRRRAGTGAAAHPRGPVPPGGRRAARRRPGRGPLPAAAV